MTGINVEKYELIQMVVDAVEEELGDKAADRVDAEQLADNCLERMQASIDLMLRTAIKQAGTERSKVIQAAAH